MMFKPLLAATLEDITQAKLPAIISPKLDGIRCIILDGVAYSRNAKPIRNRWVQHCLKGLPTGLDGELIVGPSTGPLVFNRTTSGVMSEGGTPEFKFHIFDNMLRPGTFFQRYHELHEVMHPQVSVVTHWQVYNLKQLIESEIRLIEEGFEGVMLRRPDGPYKNGRSTLNEGILLKVKRFRDGEVLITGFEEGLHNLNEAKKDALGRTVRSTHQDNMAGNGQIGTLIGTDTKTKEVLNVSPGRMTHNERIYYFNNPTKILGRIGKYKTFDYGKVNTARFCTFQGFRHPDDQG